MSEELKEYLKTINFDKYILKLKKRLKDKTVIIYGAGTLFQYIKDNYDINSLNIIGISDKKFSDDEEGQEYLGYKKIPKDKMKNYNPDFIIVAAQKYLNIIEDFEIGDFHKTKTKIYPLAKMPVLELIKEIWK